MFAFCLAAPPLAVDDTYPLTPGGDTTVLPADGILNNDNVPCGSAVTIRVVTPPTHGTLTAPPARRVAFRKQARRRGMEGGGFTYRPKDVANIVDDSYQYEIRCGDQVRGCWRKSVRGLRLCGQESEDPALNASCC